MEGELEEALLDYFKVNHMEMIREGKIDAYQLRLLFEEDGDAYTDLRDYFFQMLLDNVFFGRIRQSLQEQVREDEDEEEQDSDTE